MIWSIYRGREQDLTRDNGVNAPSRMRSKTFYGDEEKRTYHVRLSASRRLYKTLDQGRRITTQEFSASGKGSGSCQELTKP